MVYLKFLIHWCIVCLYGGKKIFSYDAPTKNVPLRTFISYKLPRGDQAGVAIDFDHLWIGEDLYQIWCFIQNLHYGCVYTLHYRALIENIIFNLRGHGVRPINCAPLMSIIFKKHLVTFVMYIYIYFLLNIICASLCS